MTETITSSGTDLSQYVAQNLVNSEGFQRVTPEYVTEIKRKSHLEMGDTTRPSRKGDDDLCLNTNKYCVQYKLRNRFSSIDHLLEFNGFLQLISHSLRRTVMVVLFPQHEVIHNGWA